METVPHARLLHEKADSATPGRRNPYTSEAEQTIPPPHTEINKKSRSSFLDRLTSKTAATYSPTVTQYHRRDGA